MKVLLCLKDQQAEAGGVRGAAAVVSCVLANVQAELLAGPAVLLDSGAGT